MSLRAVIALGGNALGSTPEEQVKKIEEAAPHIVGLISQGYEIVVTHGNGPQVGMINLALDEGSQRNEKIPKMELPECTAMSQGYIGYHLQNGIHSEMKKQGMPWKVSTVITQIEVDKNDPAFSNPSKPIGSYYTKEQAEEMMKKSPTFTYKEDSGRGYRRMVASPKPIDIVEKDTILSLLEDEFVVIACGGGGIPVVKLKDNHYEGISAVIDKDLAAARLAELIKADYLLILTAVDKVCLDFNTENQRELDVITTGDAEKYCTEGQFAPGSMLPKVQAAVEFVKSGENRKAVICSLDKVKFAMKGESGTSIIKS